MSTGTSDSLDSTSGGGSTGTDFIEPTDAPPPPECTIFEQNCPRGEKCTLGPDGELSGWETWHCVPVAPDAVGPGEPCTIDGSLDSGLDDCALGSVCWAPEPLTQEGTCVAFCEGDSDAPSCADEGSECWIPANGLFAMCFPRCDPLDPVCPESFGCHPDYGTFLCRSDRSGELGGPLDPCSSPVHWTCDSGHVCLPASWVPGCEHDDCCSALCPLGELTPACLPGQICAPVYADPPAEYDHVGMCRTPR